MADKCQELLKAGRNQYDGAERRQRFAEFWQTMKGCPQTTSQKDEEKLPEQPQGPVDIDPFTQADPWVRTGKGEASSSSSQNASESAQKGGTTLGTCRSERTDTPSESVPGGLVGTRCPGTDDRWSPELVLG